MRDLIPSLGCLGLALLVLPVWALREAMRSRRRAEHSEEQLDELRSRLDLLEKRLLEVRREARAAAGAAPPAPEPEQDRRPEALAEIPLPIVPTPDLEIPAAAGAASAPPAAFSPPATAAAPPPSAGFDWENLISVRAFAWLGGAALVLGAALFLQYSIQHGLISPAMRVAIGLAVGSLALVLGDSLKARSMWAGQATSGAGVGVLYASFYAAHTLYGLLGTTATFAAMGLVTLVAGLLAVRRQAFVLAVIGLLGGFLTPFLLASKEDHPLALLGYVLLLDIGVLAVARKRAWLALSLLGLAGSAMIYAGWASAHLDTGKVPWALGAAVLVGGLFVLGAGDEAGRRKGDDLARATPLCAALAPFLVALAISGNPTLAVSPAFLVVYLLILTLQAFAVARRLDAPGLLPPVAGVSMLSLFFRASQDLFPSHRATTLALFALVPITLVVIWFVSRESKHAVTYRMSAAIGLFGSLGVLFRILDAEPHREPILALWLSAALHAALLLAIGAVLASGAWILAAQGYLLVALLSLTTRFELARLGEFLPMVLIPAVVFWSLPFLSRRFRADHLAWLSAGAAPIVQFAILYVLARPVWGTDRLGVASIVFGALAFVALRGCLKLHVGNSEDRRFTAALFGAVTLLFLTAAIPILLDKQWITVAWALESAALAWLSTRIREEGLVKASAALAVAAFARLVLNPFLWSYHARSATPVFNWYLYTFGIPAVAFLAAARWVRGDPAAEKLRMPEGLRIFAGIVLFVLLNVEIADYYSAGPTLAFRLSGGGLAQDMTYSLAWGLFALALLFIGISRASKPARAAALVVLLLTIGKVFLHDLWDLGALYRVGSIVGLAVALLAVSFLTQRFVFAKERP